MKRKLLTGLLMLLCAYCSNAQQVKGTAPATEIVTFTFVPDNDELYVPAPKSEPKPKPKPEPVATPDPAPAATTKAVSLPPAKPNCFAIRTNLLYDAFLVPTLGVEWRVNNCWSMKVDGSFSYWGDETGDVQKIELISPEVRRYMGGTKRFYLGVGGNYGKYNIYGGMLGGLLSDDTGFQGNLWNAGLTVGYQLRMSRSLSLDFNLGLGYTSTGYDSFNMIDQVRVYKDKDQTKNLWGPTQAGVSLVWTIGGHQ